MEKASLLKRNIFPIIIFCLILVFIFRSTVLLLFSKANSFAYAFSDAIRLPESGSINDSNSPWWVDSGGYMDISSGTGKTIQGSLALGDPWQVQYAKANPIDTDNGLHPQNIFRLILKSTWKNFREEAYFRINADNLSTSPNRNESNGILLFGRYVDSQNLYYMGLRVDGHAVIKKKLNSVYSVLKEVPAVPDTLPYDKNINPGLLPKGVWIGLRAEVTTESSGAVHIKLWTDIGRTGNWKLQAEAVDTPANSVIPGPAHVGIRTDFMDVSFTNFKIQEL